VVDPSHAEILDSRVEVPQHVVFRRFATETVALNMRTGRYHGLGARAGHMVEVLVESGSVRAAAESLAADDARPYEEVATEFCELCVSLDMRGLIAMRTR
jgi:hypothetical protein